MTELSHQASSRLVVSSLLPGLTIAVLTVWTDGSAFAADSLGELRERMVRVNMHGLIVELAWARTPEELDQVHESYRDLRDLFARLVTEGAAATADSA